MSDIIFVLVPLYYSHIEVANTQYKSFQASTLQPDLPLACLHHSPLTTPQPTPPLSQAPTGSPTSPQRHGKPRHTPDGLDSSRRSNHPRRRQALLPHSHWAPPQGGGSENEARMTALARRVLSGVVTVPAVHAVVHTPNGDAILMDYVQGVPLSTIWSGLSALQRATVKQKLCDVLCAMRRSSFGYAGRPGRRPYVLLFEFGVAVHDFCADVQMWNESRARAVSKNVGDARRVGSLREKQFELVTAARFVLTHGDLSDRNILVNPDTLDIIGVLDWEYANVVSSYFEYIAARFSGGHRPYWRAELLEVLEKVLERECGEARVEEELARWKALVDVERYAQGYDDDCAWTFETDNLGTPICG
ncbi:hypothetical protein A0H81_06787 [Grifola frondosa]|uniref:Aminoglycoside phosphotransferase domain-containing protein n=1 Tax=Grifola frondosa TaxID=5627 RepID=A0A1C7M8Z4_GRIFR|nr:hypothetical protein A0H81_06787 [Grifola frondosa]